MPDYVWTTIDNALANSRPARSWAWLAVKLKTSDQVVNNWKRRKVPSNRYPEIAKVLGWTVEELLAGGPDEPKSHAVGVMSNSEGKSSLLQALVTFSGLAKTGVEPPQRKLLAQMVGSMFEDGPSENTARAIDALTPQLDEPAAAAAQKALARPEPIPDAGTAVDRAFREAFYSIADEMKSKHGSALFNDLRAGIEHRVAEILCLDIEQARQALLARQSDQG